MAVTLHFRDLQAEQIAFGYSPAQETLASLHILTDYKHHPLHIPWAIRMRTLIRPALRAEADTFAALYARSIATLWPLQSDQPFHTFADDLAALARAPVTDYIAAILETVLHRVATLDDFADAGTWDAVLARVMQYAPQSYAMLVEARATPEQSRDRFLAFIAAYWEAGLAAEWPRIEELFVQDIAGRGRALFRHGPIGLLDTLSPALWLDPDAAIAVARYPAETTATLTRDDYLLLTPSYFAWPHLRITPTPPVSITYPVVALEDIGTDALSRDRMLQIIRALGDGTRLEMLQLLAHRPRSTQELAGLVGRTEAAVSKNLKQLQAAGLLTPERRGYYVWYRLSPEPLQELMQALSRFSHQESAHEDEP